MALVSKVFTSLEDIAIEWDSILPQNHPLRSAQLMALERAHLPFLTFNYLFCYEAGSSKLAAVVYFQYVHFNKNHYQYPLFKNLLARSIEKYIMRRGFHILICGNVFRIDCPGFYFTDPDYSVPDFFELQKSFAGQLVPAPDATLLKDWQEPFPDENAAKFGYRRWPGDLTMKMDILPEWKNFSDYEKALKHKYAQRLRKIQNMGLGIERKELEPDEIEAYGAQIIQLYTNVVKKQVVRLVIANKDYFIEMKKLYGGAFHMVGYFAKDQLIGFSSHIEHGDCWELHYIGIDYEKNEQYKLYFNIMYDGIAMAIAADKKSVELGRTAREAKAMLGAKPIYFHSYYKLNSWLVNRLVAQFAGRFNEKTGELWQNRHPYKKYTNHLKAVAEE